MSEKLKPCPFCGGEVKKIYYYDGIGAEYFGVHCERCRFTYGAETEYKRNTVNRWNRRAAGWIKTSERLPDKWIWVLMAVEYGKGLWYEVGMIKGDYFMDTSEIYYHPDKVPFWMYLPDEPEVEE